MRSNAIGVLIVCLAVIAISLPSSALAGQGISTGVGTPKPAGPTVVKPSGAADCNLVDFEGVGDFALIGVIAGPVTVTFGTSWYGLVDADDGGSGNFANEPSSNTIAFFPFDLADLKISLSPSVQYVEFFYSAAAIGLPVTVRAYDSSDNLIDSAVGSTVGTDYDGAPCTGDPTGAFCSWSVVSLTAASDNIAYVTITGPPEAANYFGIDNLQFCTTEQESGACCLPDGSCAELSADGCKAAGGTWYANVKCGEVKCTVPTKNSTWGGIKALYRTP
jgi:hypothetical protein